MTEPPRHVRRLCPAELSELVTLGCTLKRRAIDVLAYLDKPGTSNGPIQAINGQLERLRGTALGFRNLANYITRDLLETGGFRPKHTLFCDEQPLRHPESRAISARPTCMSGQRRLANAACGAHDVNVWSRTTSCGSR